MQIFVAAVKEAGSFDPERIREALASITVETITGLYKPNEQGHSPIDVVAFQIQNGKRVIVWPKHVAEAKPCRWRSGRRGARSSWLPVEVAPGQQWSLEGVRKPLVSRTHLLNRIFD